MKFDTEDFEEIAFILFTDLGEIEGSLLRYFLYGVGVIALPLTILIGLLFAIKT